MLATNPEDAAQLDEIEDDLLACRARDAREDWLGEAERIVLVLTYIHHDCGDPSARVNNHRSGIPNFIRPVAP